MKSTTASYWDLLSYDIRKIIYSYVRKKEEPDYTMVMKTVFYDIWKCSWLYWIENIQDPIKKMIVKYSFLYHFPNKYGFHRYKWKTPDSVNVNISVYKLKTAKTGFTVKVDGYKICKGYLRTQNQFLDNYSNNKQYGYLLKWIHRNKTEDCNYYRQIYYFKSTDLYLTICYHCRNWMYAVLTDERCMILYDPRK